MVSQSKISGTYYDFGIDELKQQILIHKKNQNETEGRLNSCLSNPIQAKPKSKYDDTVGAIYYKLFVWVITQIMLKQVQKYFG